MDMLDAFDLDELYDDPRHEIEDVEWDIEPEPENAAHTEPQTTELSAASDDDDEAELLALPDEDAEYTKVKAIAQYMKDTGVRLDTFLGALFYGSAKCTSDLQLRSTRKQLTRSPRLQTILDNIHTPSRYTGAVPAGASKTMNTWAWRHTLQLTRHELNKMAEDARVNGLDDDANSFPDPEYINLSSLKRRAQTFSPNLLRFLTLAGETKTRGRARERQKDSKLPDVEPSFAAIMNVYSLAFQYAPRCNRFQKHLSLYFRAKHVPKSLYPLFNKCGYTTSYSWSNNAISALAKAAIASMKAAVEKHAIIWIYDNLRLPTPIKAQRGDRHTVTDNGTAMTVVMLPDSVKEVFFKSDTNEPGPTDVVEMPKNLCWGDFLDFNRFERLAGYNISLIVEILFDTVPGLSDLEIRYSSELAGPKPLHKMTAGKENRTKYFMLGTVPIDETSIGGNMQVIAEMARQTELDSESAQKMLGTGLRTIPVVGDQMTTARIRGLRTLRVRDPNGYERLQWVIVVPGWFHILLNLGMSTFDAHRGSDRTSTFYKDLTFLNRSGLNIDMRKKRPSFFTNDEFLRHKLFALIRSLWMHYLGTSTPEELVRWVKGSAAAKIAEIARKIFDERVSSAALKDLSRLPESDAILQNTTTQTRDLLQYHSLQTAIQTGNVGWLEDLLPNLIVYFKGRKNHNYAQELAETLHWMRHEASPEMSAAVRDHVWLVNTSGRSKGFYEADRLQEFNNDKQKRFGPPPQTTSWDAHKEVAPAIPVLGELAQEIEDNLFDFQRSRVHQEMNAELDIDRLSRRHLNLELHKYSPGRKIEVQSDLSKDYFQIGTRELMNDTWLADLATNWNRNHDIQSTEQYYSLVENAGAEGHSNQETQGELHSSEEPDVEMS